MEQKSTGTIYQLFLVKLFVKSYTCDCNVVKWLVNLLNILLCYNLHCCINDLLCFLKGV